MGLIPGTERLDNSTATKIEGSVDLVTCDQCGNVNHLPTIIKMWEEAKDGLRDGPKDGPSCTGCTAKLCVN